MNKKNLKILNDFANSHSLATNIKVEITDYHKSFKPRGDGKAYYDEANLLASLIIGAESLIYYIEREGYAIKKV